jgi:hypothetical protein
MTESPPNCLICGKGNTPDAEGNVGPFLDMERDVNWGDPTYLCEDCGTKIGAMFGMVTTTEVEELKAQTQGLKKQLHDEKSRYETFRRRTSARAQAVLEEAS